MLTTAAGTRTNQRWSRLEVSLIEMRVRLTVAIVLHNIHYAYHLMVDSRKVAYLTVLALRRWSSQISPTRVSLHRTRHHRRVLNDRIATPSLSIIEGVADGITATAELWP